VHGTLATITANSSERAKLESQIGAILGAFAIPHEIKWID
jgi:hypothetical protein